MKKWLAKRRRKREWETRVEKAWIPMYDLLARFNTERARGITHSPEFVALMKETQERYDREYVPLSSFTRQ